MGSGASKAPRDDRKPRIVSPAPILDISEASKRSMAFRPSQRRRDTQKRALGKNAKAHTPEPPPGAAGDDSEQNNGSEDSLVMLQLLPTQSKVVECGGADRRVNFKETAKPGVDTQPKTQTETEMRKEAHDILDAQLKLFQQKKDAWKTSDLTSEALQKHMKAVRSAYTAFNKYPYRIKFEYRGKLNIPVVSSGTIAVACDVAVKALETGSYFARDPEKGKVAVKEQVDLLSNCLQMVCSFTDTSPKVRKAVVEHGRLLPLLVKKLDEWYQPHIDGTRLDAEERFVNKSLTALFLISAEDEKTHIDLLRAIDGFFPTLKKYLSSRNDDNRLTAIAALANVAKEAEAEDIAAEKEMVRFLLLQLKQTFQNENRCSSVGWTIVGLGKVVKKLARNDANKQLLVKEGALPLLVDGLKPEYQKSVTSMEKKRCMESLWWLSFGAQNREEMAKNETLLDLVVSIYNQGPSSDPGNSFVPAEGFLFQMRENLREKDKYRSIANKLLGEKLSQEPAASGHVMMSYQTQYRPIVKTVCDFLGQNGFKMWMDIYHMADGEESTLQTMADAVEGSAVVIMCVSESYKDSPYCRAEAEYAFMKNKHIIPLKLQKGYTPDGWLGIIQGSKYFYDFTKEDRLEEKRLQLLEAVRKAFAAQAGGATGDAKQVDQPPSSAAPSFPPSMPMRSLSVDEKVKTWTPKDIRLWLQKFGLKGPKVEALTAEEVLYLYNLKSEAPEFFHSMVRTDLELGTISSLASFNKALTELPSFASENNE